MNMFCRAQATTEDTAPDEQASEAGNSHTELSVLEKDCCKQNFQFYDKAKQGFVERFELPMVLTSKFMLLI
jgi:Ca2+-binding EF-hand superfamily protein